MSEDKMNEEDIIAQLAKAGKDLESGEAVAEESSEAKAAEIDTSKYTEFEQEQMKLGWKPDGEKSAEEWARAKPLYDEIKNRGKQLSKMQEAIDQLTSHMKKQEEIAYQKALKKLNKEKQDAIERGDVQEVMEVEKKYEEMNQQPKEPPAEVKQFFDKYSDIFNSSNYDEMQIAEFAYARDKQLGAKGLPLDQHMKTLEEHMKKQFPNYFGYEKEVVARNDSGVESTTSAAVAGHRPVKSGKLTFNDLTDEQKAVARNFEQLNIMSIDEYLTSIKDEKEYDSKH